MSTVVSLGQNVGAGTTVALTGLTVANGDSIAVGVEHDGAFTSLVDNKGNTYNAVTPQQTQSGILSRMYRADNVVGGAANLNITLTTATGNLSIYAYEITGAQTSPLDQQNAGTDASSPYGNAISATPTVPGVAISFIAGNSATTPATHTESTGFIIGPNVTTGGPDWTGAMAYLPYTALTAIAAQWTENGASGAAVHLMLLKDAALPLPPAVISVQWEIEADWKPQRWDFTLDSSFLFDDFLPASGPAAYSLTAAQGSYSLTGQTAGLRADRKMTAVQGSYNLTGQIAGLKFGHNMTGVQGQYNLNGQSVNLRVARILLGAQGQYNLNGQSANLIYSGAGPKVLTADFGTYALNGQSASLRASRTFLAAPGAYTLTGITASLKLARVLAAAQGSYSLQGQNATLIYSGAVPSSPGDGGNYIIYFRRRHRRS